MATYKVTGIKDAAILFEDAGAVDEQDIPFGNRLTIGTEFDTITFEGDGQTEEIYRNIRATGEIGGDKFDTQVLEKVFNKSAVNSGLPAAEASRYYFGDDSELAPPPIGLQVDLAAIDEADESAAIIRVTVFKVQMRPFRPQDAANVAKWGTVYAWSSKKTTTDVAGDDLPGVPTDGAHYAVSVLS